MRILILNWRDLKNPQAGGAELLTHELAKRWVAGGHSVTLFSSGFPGGRREERIDGVAVIRRGGWWSVHVLAFFYYFFRFRRRVDLIVDEVHWYPFFSVLYARKKTVLLACEVAHRLFFRLFPYPVALLGRWLEKLYFFLYRNVAVLAISSSTKRELIAEGIPPAGITELPMGVSGPATILRSKKNTHPTLIFVGRLHPLKGVGEAIAAFALIRRKLPSAKLWIVGRGEAQAFGPVPSVTFFGWVTEERKFALMQQAHLLLVPSVQEGWGLVVAEGAAVGTPSVAYDSPGLRDVLKTTKCGVLTTTNTPQALAREALLLLRNPERYRWYQKQGRKQSRKTSWEDTARVALSRLRQVYEKDLSPHH